MKRALIAAPALCAAVFAPAGHAWEPGPYLGFGLGVSEYDLDERDYDDGSLDPRASDLETSDTAYRIFGGYRITRNLGVELFYANLGEADFRGESDGSGDFWFDGPVRSEEDVDGIGLSILGNVTIGRDFNLYGKVGLFAYTWESEFADSEGRFRDRETDTELMYGAGVSYQVDYRTSVHVEWERYTEIVDSFDADLFTVNLSFDLY